jgi:hypothetical protein
MEEAGRVGFPEDAILHTYCSDYGTGISVHVARDLILFRASKSDGPLERESGRSVRVGLVRFSGVSCPGAWVRLGTGWTVFLACCSVRHVPIIQTDSCGEQTDGPRAKQTLGLPLRDTRARFVLILCLLLLSEASRTDVGGAGSCVFNSRVSLPEQISVTPWHFL